MSKSYSYYTDGQLSFSSDASDHRFDRSYSYDHAARITQAFSGAEARGEPATNNRPYKQTFSYDGFSHLANRNSHIWPDFYASSDTYVNNRRTWWSYDAAGNLLGSDDAAYAYDAAGSMVTVSTYEPESTTTRSFDGHGQQVKSVTSTYDESTESWSTLTKYYVRSTVMGGKVITELDQNGAKTRTFVFAGSQMLAAQDVIPFFGSQGVTWEHRDPSNATYRTTMVNGDVSAYAELDPTGADAGLAAPLVPLDEGDGSLSPYPSFGNPQRPGTTYSRDRVRVPADYFLGQIGIYFHESGAELAAAGATASSRRIGYRIRGVHWGTPLEQEIYEDGRRSIEWGDYDPNLAGVLYGVETPIYSSSSWSQLASILTTPQNTGFLIGRFGFSASETERLRRAYDKITSENCRKFFDDTLAALRRNGQIQSGFQTTPNTLSQALSITTINRYSSNLTARDVGVSQKSWANVKSKFDNRQGLLTYTSGATLADGRIFLGDNAFYQAGSITQLFIPDTDLPGVIVHELFHRAGLSESQIKARHAEIQRNCGRPGDAL